MVIISILDMCICILNIQNARINQHRETLQSVFKRLRLEKEDEVWGKSNMRKILDGGEGKP